MPTMLQVRIDDDLKEQSTMVFEQLGIDLSTAVRMFLKKSVAVNGIPFELKNGCNTTQTVKAVSRMRETAERNGVSDMSLDEINAIIGQTRAERKRKL